MDDTAPSGVPGASERHEINYTELPIWQKSMDLLRPVHDIANQMPTFEQSSWAAQLRRDSRDVARSLGAACDRAASADDFGRLVGKAIHRVSDIIVLLRITKALGYAPAESCDQLIAEHEGLRRELREFGGQWHEFVQRLPLWTPKGPNP